MRLKNQPKSMDDDLGLIKSIVLNTGYGVVDTEVKDRILTVKFLANTDIFEKDSQMLSLCVLDIMSYSALRVRRYGIKTILCTLRLGEDVHNISTPVELLCTLRSNASQRMRKRSSSRILDWFTPNAIKRWVNSSQYINEEASE